MVCCEIQINKDSYSHSKLFFCSMAPFSVGDRFLEVFHKIGKTRIWSNLLFCKEHVSDFLHDYRNRSKLIKTGYTYLDMLDKTYLIRMLLL